MPARQTYQTHRFSARPSDRAPADAKSGAEADKLRAAQIAKLRSTPVSVTKGFLTDLRRLVAMWRKQANGLEKAAGATLITGQAARAARIDVLRRVAANLEEIIVMEESNGAD
jgi:hypothetical protein